MKRLAMQVIEHDRGLGTAYERWCFYQLMTKWAEEYDVASALEGPLDGMAGVRGVHCAGLARSGVRVVAAVTSEDAAAVARGVYARTAARASVDVRVITDEANVRDLPSSDMVLLYHGLPFADGWQSYLISLAKLARPVCVVATCTPDNWGFAAVSLIGRVQAPDVWRTETLAPVLWELGRVREHVYFDAPWWPDLPVAPGQSLANRLKQLFIGSGGARFAPPERDAVLSPKYVYGPERWPYFGGPGWLDDLEPALLRHPAFEGSTRKVVQRAAHLHAFVVDMRPRTPQAKRRINLVAAGEGGEKHDVG
jgi:hypothetical protein